MVNKTDSRNTTEKELLEHLLGDAVRPVEKQRTVPNSWLMLLGKADKGEPVKEDKPSAYKLEKNREERNGVKRPSAGCLCRQVWDLCDALEAEFGKMPTSKELQAKCEGKGWNVNNVIVEYYNWRKFMGYSKPRKKVAD